MRGQGYDGAGNMRGVWNRLQALFLKDCPYAFYVHCFTHRLQLSLVVASEDCNYYQSYHYFSKRHTEFHSAQVSDIAKRLEDGELKTGRGANQIDNLQRAGTTRWSSHLSSANSLIHLFDATHEVHESIKLNENAKLKGQTKGACKAMKKFKFVFILHLAHSIMGITDIFSSTLHPRDNYKAFDIDNICKLAEEFYPADFFEQERVILKSQLQNYIIDIPQHPNFQNLNTIGEVCQALANTRKSLIYYLIDRLIRLVLTLPVPITTTERVFSSMKLIKTPLRNKMEDKFLSVCMTLYLEKDMSKNIDVNSIIDEFSSVQQRRVLFH